MTSNACKFLTECPSFYMIEGTMSRLPALMLFYIWHQSQNFVASPNCLLSGQLLLGCLNLHFSANTPVSWIKKEKAFSSVSGT